MHGRLRAQSKGRSLGELYIIGDGGGLLRSRRFLHACALGPLRELVGLTLHGWVGLG